MLQHVFIAGGSSGIGFATARFFAERGFKVTITGRDQTRLVAAAATLQGDIAAVPMDAADPAQRQTAFAEAGPIDHLVLALGSGKGFGPFALVEPQAVREGFEEKVIPHFACAQAALPTLRRDGSITFVAAVSAHAAAPGTAGIGAANAAVAMFAPILASELRPLRVNAVSPGVIDTPWWDFLNAEEKQAVFTDYAAKAPVGRVGRPEDIAEAIGFLVSNTFMTGHVIVCDGGLRLAA